MYILLKYSSSKQSFRCYIYVSTFNVHTISLSNYQHFKQIKFYSTLHIVYVLLGRLYTK